MVTLVSWHIWCTSKWRGRFLYAHGLIQSLASGCVKWCWDGCRMFLLWMSGSCFPPAFLWHPSVQTMIMLCACLMPLEMYGMIINGTVHYGTIYTGYKRYGNDYKQSLIYMVIVTLINYAKPFCDDTCSHCIGLLRVVYLGVPNDMTVASIAYWGNRGHATSVSTTSDWVAEFNFILCIVSANGLARCRLTMHVAYIRCTSLHWCQANAWLLPNCA